MKLQLLSGLGVVNDTNTIEILDNSSIPKTAQSMRNEYITNIINNSQGGATLTPIKNMEAERQILTPNINAGANTQNVIPSSSKYYASYIDIKTNPERYNQFINVPAFLAALEEAYIANSKGQTTEFAVHLSTQMNELFIGKKGLNGDLSLTSDDATDNIVAGSIFATTGIPIPPGAIKYLRNEVQPVIDQFTNWLDEVTGWGPGDNGKDMPNGGIIMFYKYFKGEPNYGKPIKKEPMSVGYFKTKWKGICEADTKNRLTFSEMEGLFQVYFPILREGIDYNNSGEGTTVNFWNKVIELEKIRKNPPIALTEGNFDWIGGQSGGQKTGIHLENGFHDLKKGDTVSIQAFQGTSRYDGTHLVDYVGTDDGQQKTTMFVIDVVPNGMASGKWKLISRGNGNNNNNTNTNNKGNNEGNTNMKPLYILGGIALGGGILYLALKPKKRK